MYVKAIVDYDEFSGEMNIIVTDGKFDVLCYYWPIQSNGLKIGQTISLISTYMAKDIMTAESNCETVKKTDESRYSYFLIGKVTNIEKGIVSIGELNVELDGYLPGDVKIGDIVEFSVAKMDAYI